MKDVIEVFRALSDETRLRILSLLLVRECCVCEVMQALEISQTRASRNLNILYDAGFLRSRRDGVWSLYSIDREGMAAYLPAIMGAVEKSLGSNGTVRQDRDRLNSTERIGQCGVPRPWQ